METFIIFPVSFFSCGVGLFLFKKNKTLIRGILAFKTGTTKHDMKRIEQRDVDINGLEESMESCLDRERVEKARV